MILPGASSSQCSCASAAEWNVRAVTPLTPSLWSRARISPAALSVNVTARISPASNAPHATWFATRRVIVVVFPEPAPARMQTAPRTADRRNEAAELRRRDRSARVRTRNVRHRPPHRRDASSLGLFVGKRECVDLVAQGKNPQEDGNSSCGQGHQGPEDDAKPQPAS